MMGVAYFLISMNQVETFDELQWFDTIKRHYAAELQQIREQMNEPNEPKLKQILLRKEQRIELQKDVSCFRGNCREGKLIFVFLFCRISKCLTVI